MIIYTIALKVNLLMSFISRFNDKEIEHYNHEFKVHEKEWILLREIFDFCHKLRIELFGFQDNCTCIQLAYLMRMADTLRIIQTSVIIGYPEQAGMLCASLWEMTHTVLYFSHNARALEKYVTVSSVPDSKMPGILGVQKRMTWKVMASENDQMVGSTIKLYKIREEFKIYKNLCGIKHSRPGHINKFLKENTGELQVLHGPYKVDLKRWDTLEAGRETLMATESIVSRVKNNNELVNQQSELIEKYQLLLMPWLSSFTF